MPDPPAPAQPTPANQRIEAMDVLRGVAVLGILLVNINVFALPLEDADAPYGLGYRGPIDAVTFAGVGIAAQGKFMSLFALLFGAGVTLMVDRRRQRGEPTAGLHYRRIAALAGLGFIHGLFIWFGDILLPYALCGALLYPLLLLPPKWATRAALIAWAVALAGALLFGLLIFWLESFSTEAESAAIFADEVELMRGGLLDVMEVRFVYWLVFMVLFPFLTLPWVTALMLTGAVALRGGWVTGQRPPADYRRLLAVGLAIGLPVAALRILVSFTADPAVAEALWMPLNLIDAAALAAAWLALVMLACRLEVLGRARRVLAAVGRMALTNYLAQSVLCTLLFYGYGLGLFASLSRTALLMVVLGVWTVQLLWSPWWLARRPRGPIEAAWRRVTYGRPVARA